MSSDELKKLAEDLAHGQITVAQFLAHLPSPSENPGGLTDQQVTLDLDRARRCGFPEVIYAEGKRPQTVVEIARQLQRSDLPVLATRVNEETQQLLREAFPAGTINAVARTFRLNTSDEWKSLAPQVAVVTAGTSDQAVAEEAKETLAWMNVSFDSIYDVGVAGPHRLFEQASRLRELAAIIVVAGMEGALPSVVGGWVDCPIFAVPTSVGYGASFGGVSALLGMLNSCASNVAVVNIDAGFRAAYLAGMVAKRLSNT